MRIENGVLLDELGAEIKENDLVVIGKILTDQDSLEFLESGDMWTVAEIDIKDEDTPLYLTRGAGIKLFNEEWVSIGDAEIFLKESMVKLLDEQMEQVKSTAEVQSIEVGDIATEVCSNGIRIQDGYGDITVCINGDGEFVDNDERIKHIVKRQLGVYIAKNDDYGDSVLKGRVAFGAISELTRMSDKINRFNALVGKEETAKVAESLDDTVMDLVNYMAMYYSDLKALNSLSQVADNLVNILINPKTWLERLSREVCMEHCLDINSKEFNKLVDKVKYLR